MTDVTAVRVGGEPEFVAHVFRGDTTNPRRIWVCLRGEVLPSAPGWVGCWSCKNDSASGRDVEKFIMTLAEKVRAGGRSGPMGPYLDGHYFFDGWETWGMGIPGPILSMNPESVASATESVVDLDNFTYRG